MADRERIEQILIVRLAALGDVARATALLARIRHERPRAKVTWVAATGAVPLLRLVPGIDELVPVSEERLFRGSAPARITEVVSVWLRLARKNFDLAILAHPDRRYRALLAGVRTRKVRALPQPTRESRTYVGDDFARLLDDAPARDDHSQPQYPLADLRDVVASVALPDAARLPGDKPVALLVPGGARNILRDDPLRRWPLESYARLAQGLLGDGYHVALVGAASDAWVRPSFAGLAVHDLIGALDIPQLLRLMAGPVTVVSHDTGPLHLAQLVRANVIALFGPTVPGRVVGLASNVVSLWGGAHLACRPCYDGSAYAPCLRNRCMEDIAVDDVLRAVKAATVTSTD